MLHPKYIGPLPCAAEPLNACAFAESDPARAAFVDIPCVCCYDGAVKAKKEEFL